MASRRTLLLYLFIAIALLAITHVLGEPRRSQGGSSGIVPPRLTENAGRSGSTGGRARQSTLQRPRAGRSPRDSSRRLQEKEKTCKVLVYTNVTEAPTRKDDAGSCPVGHGPRAFILDMQEVISPTGAVITSARNQNPTLREVAPQTHQYLFCSINKKCYFAIRGFGMMPFDSVSVLPHFVDGTPATCPPPLVEPGPADDVNNRPVTVTLQNEKTARMYTAIADIPRIDYSIFELPVRAVLEEGKHTVCFAPSLATEAEFVDDLAPTDFHYTAGTLELTSRHLFKCDFEDGVSSAEDIYMPCGFISYRDKHVINLVWQIGSGATETVGTGPSFDSTLGKLGNGKYAYLDSPGYARGAPATMISPLQVFEPGTYCAHFSYHMFGEDVSALRVYLHKVALNLPENHERTLLGNWGSPRWVAVGNKGDKWHRGGFEFDTREDMEAYQMVIEGLAGSSEQGDIAIDDIEITPGVCPENVKDNMPKTIGNPLVSDVSLVCGEVRLITGHDATDKSWYLDGAVSCAGRGYSLDMLNSTAWLPCCVPHLGTYRLVLEDSFGDGWQGSILEFRFFDRLIRFGEDEFQEYGTNKAYNVVIGHFEITGVKATEQAVDAQVRVAKPNSYVWCGVVQAAKDDEPLQVKLDADVLKKYGVRSKSPTTKVGEEVTVSLRDVLKSNAAYDLYCFSEIVGEDLQADVLSDMTEEERKEKVRREILASRYRVTTDATPPTLEIHSVEAEYHGLKASVSVDESAIIWCDARPRDGPASGGPMIEQNPEMFIRSLKHNGVKLDIEETKGVSDSETIILKGLVPDTVYEIYCYAEDKARPKPNRMPINELVASKHVVKTPAKVPEVTIVRHRTLLKGFQVFVRLDAPGTVWCAAAPPDYGVPSASDLRAAGASTDVDDISKEAIVDIKGVEANSQYTIYCLTGTKAARGTRVKYSTDEEIAATAVELVSYGRYCDVPAEPKTFEVLTDVESPFQPLSATEEMKVREYMESRKELDLAGVYRINLLPNKTEIYDYLENEGPEPLRFARVRVGRCVNNIGYYEQFKVGPINGDGAAMTYERLAVPVETECGGYAPQGIFGRRRLAILRDEVTVEKFDKFLNATVGFMFAGKQCSSLTADRDPKKCLELGPVVIEDAGNVTTRRVDRMTRSKRNDQGSQQQSGSALTDSAKIWLGMKTHVGDPLPLYFLYRLPATASTSGPSSEWVKHLVQSGEVPRDFGEIWNAEGVWYNGQMFKSLDDLIEAYEKGNLNVMTLDQIREKREEEMKKFRNAVAEEQQKNEDRRRRRRRLAPAPFPGAAGTAGPGPYRATRRGGLEYRAHPEHIEPEGRRFTVKQYPDGETFNIEYAGWNMTVTNDRDTSLRIWNLRFLEKRIAFEIGLLEALAHYSVSERAWFFLDSWYGGLGAAARKVYRGVECPKTGMALFWDGSLCVFEQDMARPIRSHWKSGEIRDGAPHMTLVLRQILTVSNYDYITDYRFHLNGIFEGNVAFTGELYAGVEVPWYSARQAPYGVQVTGAMRMAALHNHVVVWRIDFDLGPGDEWQRNSILTTQVHGDPQREGANMLTRRFAETEADAAVFRNDSRAVVYEVVNEAETMFGNVGGWRVLPFAGLNPFKHSYELYAGPAAWAKYTAFSTVFKYSELDSTLPRDNKYPSKPAVSTDWYLKDNEQIRNADIVTWISDGIWHVPVVEDMPLTIPVGNTLGWMIKPSNLFYEDPSMDLHNGMGGGVVDPGTCAVIRQSLEEVEPTLAGTFKRAPTQRFPSFD